jgi:Ca2+-binding RTX toxin-like protein
MPTISSSTHKGLLSSLFDSLADQLSLGALLAPSPLIGGAGNDSITGGAGADHIFGLSGDDTLQGRGGADLLFGGDGNDVLTGGDGNDQMFGGDGNDRMIWNPGDDSDVMEGGSDIDTAEVNGGNGGETFTITANGQRVRFDRIDPAPFNLDIGTTEELVVNANGGNDTISAVGNLATLIALTLDGGDGNDTILGGNGNDKLFGGDGNDFIDGNQGADAAFMGAGNDTFQWDPGDGSDVVEGQAGTDTMLFNGANLAENFDIAANGERVLFFRNLGTITMDLNDVETIKVNALGSSDNTVVHDLTGTDAKHVAIDLAGTIGGTTGDGQADSVIADGTHGSDSITVTAVGTQIDVQGLAAHLTVDHAEDGDKLTISGLAGDDIIDASSLPAGAVGLTLSGDEGDDVLLGGIGNDALLGGADGDVLFGNDGDDTITGGLGDDITFGGAGNDTFRFTSALDGQDILADFDGDAIGGQDVFDLDAFFDSAGVAEADRAGRVFISDSGESVNVSIDADGNAANGFELLAATMNTANTITVGEDVIVGS